MRHQFHSTLNWTRLKSTSVKIAGFSVCCIAATLGVATAQPGGLQASALPETSASEKYHIAPGDVLTISIFDRPQLTRDAIRVESSGTIQMPLLGREIQAACRTTAELAKEIATRYLEYLTEPQVEVAVKEYRGEPAAVIGAVLKPGSFQLQRPVRLRELLALAGGPNPNAGQSIRIVHDDEAGLCGVAAPNESEAAIISIKLSDAMLGIGPGNPYIRAGDLVELPESQQVFVVGNIYKPSTLALKDARTVSRAIAMAGGVLPNSRQGRIRVTREIPGTTENKQITVSLSDIERKGADDLQLQAGDIVEVPLSQAKISIRTLLAAAAGASVYYPLLIIK